MKKLITAIAAIATSFGLFAADFAHSVTNDICFKTNNLVVGYDAMGATMLEGDGTAMTVNWFADSLKTDFHTNIANYEQPELKESDTEPSYKYLAIDTDVKDPVLRTFSPVIKAEGTDNYDSATVTISDHGVFIDTETTFTLFDTVPESPSDSKILVWAKETEADEETGFAGATNLMVTCGVDDGFGNITPTNYVLDVNGIVPEQMYRLTIRADKDGTENTKFRVYLNREQLKTVALEDGTTLDEFPSLVGSNQQLGAAGFGGTGSLKGIDLLTQDDAPAQVPFAIDPTYLTVTWNEGVASFTIIQDDCDDQVIEVTGSGETNLVVKAGAATVTPTFVTEPQYKLQDFLNEDETLNLEYEGNVASIDIPLYADASTLAIIAVQDREGAELWVTCSEQEPVRIGAARPRVKDAIAAMSELTPKQIEGLESVKIVLLMDEQYNDFGDWSVFECPVVLDLNGHTMEAMLPWAGDTEYRSMIPVTIPLTIMDGSLSGGGMIKGIVGTEFENSVYPIWNMSEVTIEKAVGSADCKFYGAIYSDLSLDATIGIGGGLFSDITFLQPSDNVTLPEGKEWSEDTIDGYYYLTEPGSVTLSLTAGAHNSITSEPAAGSVTPDTGVTVTVTPDTGYQFAAASYEGWEKVGGNLVSNFIITADTAITAPDATAIPYALTLTGNDTVEISSDPTADNQIPYDTNVKVTVAPVENYEFAAESYDGWEKEGANLVSNFVMKGATTITAPTATPKAAIITVPEELPAGVTELVVSQSDDEGETWTAVTKGDAGYAIVAGNMWKVEAVAAEDVRVVNPIRFGTATPGEAIAITAADFDGKITKYVWVVIAEDAPTVGAIEKVEITTNGYTFVADPSNFKIETNTIVTISATVAQGYNPATFTSQEVEIKNGQFTATNSSITVTVTTTAIGYPINVTDGTADPATFTIDGATVALAYTGTPATGESFSTWTASAGTVDGNTLTIEQGTTGEITVTPNFTNNVYAITYIYTDGTDPVVVTANTNPANFTYDIGVPSFDAAGLTYDTTKYENPQFSPTSIGTDVAEAKTVTVTFTKKQTEPIPPLPDNPTEQQKKDAVDAVVAKNAGLAGIVTTENYSAFRDWARATGTDPVVAEQAVLDSTKAGVSFQLSPIVETKTLFTNEPVVNFTAIAGNGNNWDVTLQLKDGAEGAEVELAIGAAAAHFAQFIKKGSEVNAITDTCSASDITAAVKPGDDPTSKQVKLTVVPPTGGKGFIKFLAEKPTQSETP